MPSISEGSVFKTLILQPAQMRPKVGIRFLLNPNPQQQEPLSVSDFSLRLIDSTEYFLKEGPERMAAAARKAVKAARQRAGVRVF